MQDQSLLIRADGSQTMGMGHISRCIALAQSCADFDIPVFFACGDIPSEAISLIERSGFQILYLHKSVGNIESDAKAIIKLANSINARWLVIDHPEIAFEHEIQISKSYKGSLIVIDGQFRSHHCDVLVNPNAFATLDNCRHTVPSDCRILAGYRYFIINDSFLDLRETSEQSVTDHSESHILVTMGGSDPENVTLTICQALSEADFGSDSPIFDIVIGPTNPHRSSINRFLGSVSSDNFRIHDAPDNLVKLLGTCTVCVSAGGITIGEAAFLGKPIIGIAILENQRKIIKSLDDLGVLLMSSCAQVASECKNLLQNTEKRRLLSDTASALVDGYGKKRIANSIFDCSAHEG